MANWLTSFFYQKIHEGRAGQGLLATKLMRWGTEVEIAGTLWGQHWRWGREWPGVFIKEVPLSLWTRARAMLRLKKRKRVPVNDSSLAKRKRQKEKSSVSVFYSEFTF